MNVLIALIDPTHTRANDAHRWFERLPVQDWATCPITENGLLRIVGNPRYGNYQGGPAVVAGVLHALRARPGHQFWADDISLLDPSRIKRDYLTSHSQVTDTYLLALARARGGQFATFDRRLTLAAVPGGKESFLLIQ